MRNLRVGAFSYGVRTPAAGQKGSTLCVCVGVGVCVCDAFYMQGFLSRVPVSP